MQGGQVSAPVAFEKRTLESDGDYCDGLDVGDNDLLTGLDAHG
ncbi:hypothetical protein [Tautonia plasticadhaerens]|uniref:Uncharacterized protein n=1 Tax=Tautonia plasticadhaerens TaxID=2527974 RepID=A0A518HA75_9BACT|nr:hypothetical protein [Tautonia plasticadhaerens]QDV37753.1 hypothetical protein ElP_56990 [Tautonia plasticadhaerens]